MYMAFIVDCFWYPRMAIEMDAKPTYHTSKAEVVGFLITNVARNSICFIKKSKEVWMRPILKRRCELSTILMKSKFALVTAIG